MRSAKALFFFEGQLFTYANKLTPGAMRMKFFLKWGAGPLWKVWCIKFLESRNYLYEIALGI